MFVIGLFIIWLRVKGYGKKMVGLLGDGVMGERMIGEGRIRGFGCSLFVIRFWLMID